MSREPSWYAKSVDSPDTFVAFLTALREHQDAAAEAARHPPPGGFDIGPGGWENWTIAEFLAAMEEYAMNTALPAQPSWRDIARLLLAGKGYE